MKTIVYLSFSLILVLALTVGVALMNLSSFIAYAMTRLTNGAVHVSKTRVTYRAGVITADFSDVRVKKKGIEGLAKTCRLVMGVDRGLYVKQVSVSDLEAVFQPDIDFSFLNSSGGGGLFSVPRELIEIRRGVITYDKHRFIIDKFVAKNLKGKSPFSFDLEARNDGLFGTVEASGEGALYRGLETDLKGKLSVTSLNLNELDSVMQGRARTEGTFTLEKKRLAFEGLFDLLNYTLRDPIFTKPFSVAEARGTFACLYAKGTMDVKIRGGKFKDTPLDVDLKFKNNKLARFELTCGLVDIQDVKDLIALDRIADAGFEAWSYVREGRVGIRKFVYEAKKGPHADLELKQATVLYHDKKFIDAEGELSFDDRELRVSGARGSYRASSFYNVSGTVPFAKGKDITARGTYRFSVKDIPPLPELSELALNKGQTDGVIQVEGSGDRGYKIRGTGNLNDVNVTWRSQALTANGAYSFNNDEIVFDPLVISKGRTDIVAKGRWDNKSMGMQLKGNLDVDHVKPFISIPFDVNGITGLNLEVQKNGSTIRVDGDVSMNELFFEIPGVVRKDKGVKSGASLTIVKDKEETRIERLQYGLDAIGLKAKGVVKADKTINGILSINVPGIERVAPLFFFDGELTRGNLELSLALRDLRFPLKKLPYVEGYARINNGFVRLPWIEKPLKEINLVSDFKGDKFDMRVTSLKCGASVMNSGTLQLEGLETPHFSLYVDMEKLDFDDFETSGDRSIQPIDNSSLLAKVSGDMHVRAKKLRRGSFEGQYLDAKGLLRGRKLNVSEFKMNALDGNIDMLGYLDLSEPVPSVYASGRLSRMRSGLLAKTLGAKTELADGRMGISGSMESRGKTIEELVGNASGSAAILSLKGSILKWNLLSKVLGLLNVYDSLRGKVDLGKEGLPYNKMGATFIARRGIFSTKDFLIDSPSMVITGDGEIDAKSDQLDGNIKVSPLVALDRTIDKIPILRNILQGKGKGFLSVAYKVKGHIDDPDISVSFVNTIGGNTLNILRNILVLPKELLEGMQN